MSVDSSDKNTQKVENTGSSSMGEPVYLTIGILGKPHGISGEILMYLRTDFPERIRNGKFVYLGEHHKIIKIESVRKHSRGLILRFEGIQSIEEVENLRQMEVYVKTENLPPLPANEYYHHQLLGMRVFDENEIEIGVLTEILETGANDVYVVKCPNGKEELIPALKENLLKIDVNQKIMAVKLLNYYNQE